MTSLSCALVTRVAEAVRRAQNGTRGLRPLPRSGCLKITQPAGASGHGERERLLHRRSRAGGTLMRMASSAAPHMALANRHGPRSGAAG